MKDPLTTEQELDRLRSEVAAWRKRFPKHGYSEARDDILKVETWWRRPAEPASEQYGWDGTDGA